MNSFWPLFALLSFQLLFSFSIKAAEYDADADRKLLFRLMEESNKQEVIVEGWERANGQKRAFVDFLLNEIIPHLERLDPFKLQYRSYSLLYDKGLFKDEAEKQEWQDARMEAFKELSKASHDVHWRQQIKELYRLSQGLEGTLVEVAEALYDSTERFSLDHEYEGLTNEKQRVSMNLQEVANSSPFAATLGEASLEVQQLIKDYHAGLYTMEEAIAKKREISARSFSAFYNDIAERGEADFIKNAQLLTESAQIKGFKTWAEFSVASEHDDFKAPFDTLEGRIEFLENLLSQTDAAYDKILEGVRKRNKLPADFQLTMDHIPFISRPIAIEMKPFFPLERMYDIWKDTMIKAGFDQAHVESIHMDLYPREGKQTHAYMMAYATQEEKRMTIDANTLRTIPGGETRPAHIFIVQNNRTPGLDALSTLFHEGGHGLDYSTRLPSLISRSSTSYAEIHSKFMELMLDDRDFLLENGRTLEGEAISEALVDRFLESRAAGNLISLRQTVSTALFDLKVWQYDYVNGSETWPDRARRLHKEIDERSMKFVGVDIEGKSWHNSVFSTNHFYSGSADYMGYANADIASQLIASELLDRFEKINGRRSLYNQPLLADILKERLYKEGYTRPFPEQVEEFIKGPFSGKEFADALLKKIQIEKPKILRCSAIF